MPWDADGGKHSSEGAMAKQPLQSTDLRRADRTEVQPTLELSSDRDG